MQALYPSTRTTGSLYGLMIASASTRCAFHSICPMGGALMRTPHSSSSSSYVMYFPLPSYLLPTRPTSSPLMVRTG